MMGRVEHSSFSLLSNFWCSVAPFRVCRALDRFVLAYFPPSLADGTVLSNTLVVVVVTDCLVNTVALEKLAFRTEPLLWRRKSLLRVLLFSLCFKQKLLVVSSVMNSELNRPHSKLGKPEGKSFLLCHVLF